MKKETYEKLGAKQFKKIVLKFEKIKWRFIKNHMPNYLKRCEHKLKKQRNFQIKKAKSQEEIDLIKARYKKNVMLVKKEYYTEKNINYHLNLINPDETKYYLECNKNIHKFWLKVDAIASPILIGLLATGNIWALPGIVIVGLEALKNFQCINLQNYSLCELEEQKEVIEKLSAREIGRKRKKYGEAQDVITKVISESENIPTVDKIISEAKTKESQDQIRELFLKEHERRNKELAKKDSITKLISESKSIENLKQIKESVLNEEINNEVEFEKQKVRGKRI